MKLIFKTLGVLALVLAALISPLVLIACGGESDYGSGGGGGYYPEDSFHVPAPSSASSADGGMVAEGTYWLQLSADDSTSMASAQIAKLGMRSGALHAHEFINYYDPPASLLAEEGWAVHANVIPSVALGVELVMTAPVETSQRADLLLHLAAAPVAPEARRPWHLVYCVDISGSMAGEKLAFVKQALLRSLDHLREGDHVSIVTFESYSHVLLSFSAWPAFRNDIESVFESLEVIGGTNMIAGLNDAYEVATAHYDPSMLTRVVLFGDGDANIGELDLARFEGLTRMGNQEGVYLSSVGVGTGFDWVRMDMLADAGKGASIFLPNAGEVERMFGEGFYKLIEVAADEVSIELVLPESMKLVTFSGEETSTNPTMRVPSTILASGDDITLLAQFELDDAALGAPLTLRVSLRPLGAGSAVTYETTVATVGGLVRAGGRLYTRTALVNDYATYAATLTSDASALRAALAAYESPDEGIVEIRALVGD